MTIGIDQIGMYSPHYYVDLAELAQARDVDPNKFIIGIGQSQQAVAPSAEDIVTMAAAAASEFISKVDTNKIGMVIVGTETGIDASKSAAVIVQHLLDLPENMRTYEIKQACYGGTAALMAARDYVALHPDRTVLVVASDIARYGLASGGEVTQGAGAVAMLVSAQPRILELHDDSQFISRDIADFWRPVYTDMAIAMGKYSNEQYVQFFQDVWANYKAATGHDLADFAAINFHLPYTTMGMKALRTVLPQADEATQNRLNEHYRIATTYSRRIGNIYTGSLYLGLMSLLDGASDLKAGDLLGMFSYGSGAVGEFFSMTLVDGYKKQLSPEDHEAFLDARTKLSVPAYEQMFLNKVPYSAADYSTDPAAITSRFRLTGVKDQQRKYVNQ